MSRLLSSSQARVQTLSTSNYFFETSQACPSGTLCGWGYNGCGSCVIPRYGSYAYSYCLGSSPVFNTGITYMHAPTCTVFLDSGSTECTNTPNDCGLFDWGVGEDTSYDSISFVDPIAPDSASAKVCPGDKACDSCVNQNADKAGSGEASGYYTYNGMSITLYSNHWEFWDTPLGCDSIWNHDIAWRAVGPTETPNCNEASTGATASMHCDQDNGQLYYYENESAFYCDGDGSRDGSYLYCPSGATAVTEDPASCTQTIVGCP